MFGPRKGVEGPESSSNIIAIAIKSRPKSMISLNICYYMFKDLNRWSNKLDVPLKMNPYFPIITIPHMRGAILAQQENILKPYMDTMFKAIWVDSLNLNDQEVLSQGFLVYLECK